MATERPRSLDDALKAVATFFVWVAAACIVAMSLMVTVTVLSRFFLGEPLTALFEFSEYSILAITMLAAPLLMRTDEHVKMDLITELLGRGHWLVRATDWFVAVLVLLICGTLVWFSVETTLSDLTLGTRTSTYLAPPRWPLTALLALGSVGLLVEALRRLVAVARPGSPALVPEPQAETIQEQGI